MNYVGDIADQQPFVFSFTTRKDTGLPTTLSGTPVLSVYKDGGLTQTTVGPTLTVDFDTVTGLNKVAMAITDAFYVTGSDYSVVITTGTVNAISVVGEVVADFSIERAGGALALLKNASYGLAKLLRSTTPANTLNVDANNRAESLLGAVNHAGATVPTVTTLTGHTKQTADHAANISAILTDTGTTLENHLTDIKGTGFVKDTDSLPQCLTASGFSTHAAVDVWSVATRALTDKAGFSLTQAFPTNFADLAITVTTGKVTVGTNSDKAGYSISGTKTTLDALNDIDGSSVTVTTNSDKTGYSLTQTFPTNFASLSITGGGIVSSAESDKTGFALSAAGVDAILDEAVDTTLVGLPTTLRQLPYFCVQLLRNKLNYIKSSDTMELFEDDNIAKKWSHTMVDDATNATRGKGA